MKTRANPTQTDERQSRQLSLLAATTTALLLLSGCMPYDMGENRENEKNGNAQVLAYDEGKSNFRHLFIGTDGYVYIGCTIAVKNQTQKTVRFYILPDFAEDSRLVPQRYGYVSRPFEGSISTDESMARGPFNAFQEYVIGPCESKKYAAIYKMIHGTIDTKEDREPPHNAVFLITQMDD